MYNLQALDKFLALSPEIKRQFDFIDGHMPGNIHRILQQPCKYITLLRHPLKRAISHYFQSRINQESSCHTASDRREVSLSDFLKEKYNTNCMTKQLLGVDLPDGESQSVKITALDLYQRCQRVFRNPVTPEMLEQVKLQLRDQFLLVGVLERFDDFIFLLFKRLGFQGLPYYPIMQITTPRQFRKKLPVSESILAQFYEQNAMDMELYAYARSLFERQWETLGYRQRLRALTHRTRTGTAQRIALFIRGMNLQG